MPGPWRPIVVVVLMGAGIYFNLRRDARPLATFNAVVMAVSAQTYFNLRRDARPLATGTDRTGYSFQVRISISDEMPGPWRQDKPPMMEETIIDFNLRRDARPLATLNGPG